MWDSSKFVIPSRNADNDAGYVPFPPPSPLPLHICLIDPHLCIRLVTFLSRNLTPPMTVQGGTLHIILAWEGDFPLRLEQVLVIELPLDQKCVSILAGNDFTAERDMYEAP